MREGGGSIYRLLGGQEAKSYSHKGKFGGKPPKKSNSRAQDEPAPRTGRAARQDRAPRGTRRTDRAPRGYAKKKDRKKRKGYFPRATGF